MSDTTIQGKKTSGRQRLYIIDFSSRVIMAIMTWDHISRFWNSARAKNLLVMLVVVGAVTGGNLWLHRDDTPLELVQYSDYGFTFNHERDGYVQVGSLSGGAPSYTEGRYNVRFESDGLLEIGVFWFTDEMVPVSADENILEASLIMLFESAESEDTRLTRDNNIVSSEKDGHDMITEFFEVNDQNGDIPGMIGVWQCGERIFLFYTIYIDDFENPQKDSIILTEIWNQNLNQFKCD
jgi:hypothetical protein